MEDSIVFYRRNLPHIHPADGIFFITFRLAGSLPVSVLQQLKHEKEKDLNVIIKNKKNIKYEKYMLEKRVFGKIDKILDNHKTGPHWLKEERIAQIVADKIHEFDGKRYQLIVYNIMPNHVHLLIECSEKFLKVNMMNQGKTKNYPLADTMMHLKGNTARRCNLILKRNGAFWHHESYDHYIRNEEELGRVIHYILNNPVKAGLVENWKDWRFSYLAEHYIF